MSKMSRLDETINNELTKVIFRKFFEGDVVAFFPELLGSNEIQSCLSYQHLGQHGTADLHYCIRVTKPATEEEYKDLYNELTSIGYHLQVYKKYTRDMYNKRIKEK